MVGHKAGRGGGAAPCRCTPSRPAAVEGVCPVTHVVQTFGPGSLGRQWRCRDATRHWLLPALLPVLLTPSFIATMICFHQARVAQVKGWTLADMASGYTAFGVSTVIASIASGWAANRFGVIRLPQLLTMGVGVSLLGQAESVAGWYVPPAVIGAAPGMAGSLWGVLFSILYGTEHRCAMMVQDHCSSNRNRLVSGETGARPRGRTDDQAVGSDAPNVITSKALVATICRYAPSGLPLIVRVLAIGAAASKGQHTTVHARHDPTAAVVDMKHCQLQFLMDRSCQYPLDRLHGQCAAVERPQQT